MLNKINHEYLSNENVDKKLVEAWLDNKIRREGHEDQGKASQNTLQAGLDAGEDGAQVNKMFLKKQSTLSKFNIRQRKKDKKHKDLKYLETSHHMPELEQDDSNTQDKYEIYVKLYTEKLWRAVNKYIIAKWRPQEELKVQESINQLM